MNQEFYLSFNVEGHQANSSDWLGVFPDGTEGKDGYLTYVYNSPESKYGLLPITISNATSGQKYIVKYVGTTGNIVAVSAQFLFE